ncbi:hypothetical protein D910_11861 [Dendroctonus ponderosae]|uniref:C3H1-type domain-containing protein n=1 Tax=Dendroctonus ponderosae TaxID=77166 RepID=U4UKH8_DENPD|nr:hypothetical protein D910_11861 [Dendroctonus ponderosae]
MSVLNQSGEEQVECPLCMESLEVDDLNFFPCTCGYQVNKINQYLIYFLQICRFCWHRIRHDENGGLCPACRKPYSENPADFIPLTQEQVTQYCISNQLLVKMAKMKADKRQRDQQRKAKLTESRKHLSSVRVVQRNLVRVHFFSPVFVVGLPPRLADPEILKRHEYFGKFGKIHKVVINQSTSYAGSQGPSASRYHIALLYFYLRSPNPTNNINTFLGAYVTYIKSDDALRAIQAVNNFTIDNRSIKSSLGTTKYCSHFLKNQPCPKPDCMYLHEYGDPEASFTREQMHLGKHQEYEKKLHEDLLARTKTQNGQGVEIKGVSTAKVAKDANNSSNTSKDSTNSSGTNKENWPQLDKDKKQEKDKPRKGKTKNNAESRSKDKKEGKNSSSVENLNGFYELAKFQENLMDALATKANGFKVRPQDPTTQQSQIHISNGLEMSKFFSDYHKFSAKEQSSPSSPYQNGYSNGVHSSYPQFLHQKHLEEQFRNLALKQNTFSGAQTTLYQNSIPTPTYLNGDASLVNGGVSSMQNLYSKTQGVSQQPPNNSRNSEAELDFDPFQVTQKGFAEIMATEQNIKQHNSGLSTGRSNQMNGLVHSQNNTHIPPPPPGFLQQQQAHMNSFGSKILPFLSMSNSQQQLNNAASNWPNSFNSQLQEPKNVSNTCNDWKVLDPAILSSSRSYQLPTVPPVPDAYNIPPLANQQITHNSQLRSYDYPPSNNPFSTFAQQPNYNSFTQLNTPQNVNNLNWFTANDINSQISSPPGFRNNQTSKQQEC